MDLRAAMARFPTGVTVVTAYGADGPAGLTVNAVCSLSLDPPLMLVCLDRGSRTLRAVEHAGRFGINILDGDGEGLARSFASKAPMAEKWSGVAWRDRAGAPGLDQATVWIACELEDVLGGGDHVIVTGQVTETDDRGGEPLVFHGGFFRPLPAAASG